MIQYAISTNYEYYKQTLPRLISSMKAAGIAGRKIRVYVGRSPFIKTVQTSYETHQFLQYGAYEHTALIGYLLKNSSPFTHLFLLHDTCEVGLNFSGLVAQGLQFNVDAVSVNGGMCGFGLYSNSFLRKNQERILALKDCDKHTAMVAEGFLCRGEGAIVEYPGQEKYKTLGLMDIYSTGIPRLKEYYPQVDLYKYKANWGQTNPGTYIERL